MSEPFSPGPGTLRVGRFIGRLGVVSLPAVQAGLGLDERVVRRHVAKLESAGWLTRAPWIWGEGSVAWLTAAGIEAAGLGGIRPVKSPPGKTTIVHGVLVGWSGARAERRGRAWNSARELALNHDRWAVRMRCERGYTQQLPDLAVWLKRSGPPLALVAENGGRREDRQKWILKGWDDAIYAGQYSGVLYDCASPSVAQWIKRLAKKAGLTGPKFTACVQPGAAEIAALSPAAPEDDPPVNEHKPVRPTVSSAHQRMLSTPVPAAPTPQLVTDAEPAPLAEAESADAEAERMRRYREIFGIEEPKRRRWRH